MNNKIILFITALCTVILFNKVIFSKRDEDLTGDSRNKRNIKDKKRIKTKLSPGRAGETNYLKGNAAAVNKEKKQVKKNQRRVIHSDGHSASDINKKSRKDLYNEAKKLNIKGRSTMSKPDLIKAIKNQK